MIRFVESLGSRSICRSIKRPYDFIVIVGIVIRKLSLWQQVSEKVSHRHHWISSKQRAIPNGHQSKSGPLQLQHQWFTSKPGTALGLPFRTYTTTTDKYQWPPTSPGDVSSCVECMQETFSAGGVAESSISASLIAAHALGHKTLHGVDIKIGVKDDIWKRMVSMATKRMQNVPVQYVLGEWDFLDITLVMRPPVFIPRPETEELVKHVLAENITRENLRFLEIGSGSGAICVFLLWAQKSWTGIAVEQGGHACALTSHNAQRLGVVNRLQVLNSEFCRDLELPPVVKDGLFDLIVSNPPYIPKQDMDDLQIEISKFEDPRALCGGEDGLLVVRDILHVAPVLLKPGGSLWLEVDGRHPATIMALLKDSPLTYIQTLTDLNHIPRFVHIRKEGKTKIS